MTPITRLLTWAAVSVSLVVSVSGRIVAVEPTVAIVGDSAIADPLDRLRQSHSGPMADYWLHVAAALEALETLEGAAYDPESGVLSLLGKPAELRGHLRLDDLMIALKSVLFSNESPGMTIDPDPQDPRGPKMVVRYFGGTENSSFGWVMFECDRLLKSYTTGQDNFTGLPVRPNVGEFHDMFELGRSLGHLRPDEWNRFELTLDTGDGKNWRQQAARSNGSQPVVYQTADSLAISFAHCRVFLTTEVMKMNPQGRLVPVPSRKDAAAERFVAHFNTHYEEFAEVQPEFRRLAMLGRLLCLAEWIEQANIPMDIEYIRRYQPLVRLQTPTITPSVSVTKTTQEQRGDSTRKTTTQVIGGVGFDLRTFFAKDSKGQAARHQRLAVNSLPQHSNHIAWNVEDSSGTFRHVAVPTLRTRLAAPPKRRTNTQLRRPQAETEKPEGTLPEPATGLAQSDRIDKVYRVEMSLKTADLLRPYIRGPPFATIERNAFVAREQIELSDSVQNHNSTTQIPNEVVEFVDQRDLPWNERRETVTPERIQLRAEEFNPAVSARGPPGRGNFLANADRIDAVARSNVALRSELRAQAAPLGLPIFETADGSATYSLPRLQSYFSARESSIAEVHGAPETRIKVAKQLTIVSQLGDIMVPLGQPRIDQQRRAIYHPSDSPVLNGIVGYYPAMSSLEFDDGMRIRFGESGETRQIRLANGSSIDFNYAPEEMVSKAWPDPVSCAVHSVDGVSDEGQYRMVAKAPPPAMAIAGDSKPNFPDQADSKVADIYIAPAGAKPEFAVNSTAPQPTDPVRDTLLAPHLPEPVIPRTRTHLSHSANTILDPTLIGLTALPPLDKATTVRFDEKLPPGESIRLEGPLKIGSDQHAYTWTARLRAANSSHEADDVERQRSGQIAVAAADGGTLQIALSDTRGEVAKGSVDEVYVVVHHAPKIDRPVSTTRADFFIDLDLQWQTDQGSFQGYVPVPVRFDVVNQNQGMTMLVAMLLGVLTLSAGVVFAFHLRSR